MAGDGTDDDTELLEWRESLGGLPPFRVEVFRVKPKVWRGRRVDGKLDTVDGLPELDDLQADFGGGTLQLKVKRPDDNGRYVYAGTQIIKIAGPPKIPPDAKLAFENEAERDRIVHEIAERAAKKLFDARLAKLEAAVRALEQKA
jgi:hypothetical protein